MNDARRERIRELIRMLETVHAQLIEEETAPSQESGEDQISSEALDHLGEATHSIEAAIWCMQSAIGNSE